MSARLASLWHRAGETVLLLLAFFLPLAFYLRTYDSVAIKTTIFQLGVLLLLLAWFLKGMELGRWELPLKARPLLLPALLLAAWTALRYATAPFKIAALPRFLDQLLEISVYCVVLLEFGGLDTLRRFLDWLLAAAWVAGLYGLCQHLGYDPFIWKGAFGDRIFSTAGNPDFFAWFLALCVPLAFTRLLDPERGLAAKLTDAALLPLLGADLLWTSSYEGLWAFIIQGAAFALLIPLLLPRRYWRVAAAAAVFTAGVAFLSLQGPEPELAARMTRDIQFKEFAWSATARLAAEKPWIGQGPGSFYVHFPSVRPAGLIALEGKHNTETDHAENLALELAVELGIPGLALWLWLFGAILRRAWGTRRDFEAAGAGAESVYNAGLTATLAGCLLTAQLSTAPRFLMPAWFLWSLAGLLGGLSLVAGDAAPVAVLPIPLDARLRKLLYIPAAAALALAFFPVRWFDSDVEHNIAIADSKDGRFADALKHYDDVAPGAPAYVMAQYFKGNVLLDEKQPQAALAQYAYLETLAPDYVQLHRQQGVAYAALGDWDDAIRCFQRSLKLDPLFAPTYSELAKAAEAAGDMDTARRAVYTAIGLEPTVPEHWQLLAQIYLKEQRLAMSRQMRRQAARLERAQAAPGG